MGERWVRGAFAPCRRRLRRDRAAPRFSANPRSTPTSKFRLHAKSGGSGGATESGRRRTGFAIESHPARAAPERPSAAGPLNDGPKSVALRAANMIRTTLWTPRRVLCGFPFLRHYQLTSTKNTTRACDPAGADIGTTRVHAYLREKKTATISELSQHNLSGEGITPEWRWRPAKCSKGSARLAPALLASAWRPWLTRRD